MKDRRQVRPAAPSAGERTAERMPISYYLLVFLCGCILAVGMLFAARQHFMAMDLGMQNSKMRRQVDELRYENRRLLLEKETANSPAAISRAVRNSIRPDATSDTVEIAARSAKNTKPETSVVATAAAAAPRQNVPASRSVAGTSVVPTAYQRPAKAGVPTKAAAKPLAGKAADTKKPDLSAVAKK